MKILCKAEIVSIIGLSSRIHIIVMCFSVALNLTLPPSLSIPNIFIHLLFNHAIFDLYYMLVIITMAYL